MEQPGYRVLLHDEKRIDTAWEPRADLPAIADHLPEDIDRLADILEAEVERRLKSVQAHRGLHSVQE